MKPLLLILALSLAANATLTVKRSRANATSDSAAFSISAASSVEADRKKSAAASPASASTSTGLTTDQSRHRLFWERLRSGDTSAVEELRAAGWPADAIATLVTTSLQNSYRDRIKAIRGESSNERYWTADSLFGNLSPAQRKASNALWREQTALAKKLLGPDFSNFFTDQSWRDQRYITLPPDKAAAVRDIETDYNFLIQDVRSDFSAGGPSLVLPEDREKLAYLEKEKRADLARTLTPDELLDYDLRASSIANTLRYSLEAFSPSEQEFRALYRAQQEAADRLGYVQTYGRQSQKDQDLAKQLQTEVDAQAKQLLGEQRYAEYTRAKDFEYRRLYQLGKRLDLPAAAITAAHTVKADVEKQMQELMKSPDAKDRALLAASSAVIVDDAEARMKQALGQRGYEVYTANSNFISGLRRSASPPPAPRPAPATTAPAAK